VPPARLKVPWAAVGVFREREARWDRIDKLGIGDEPVSRAAEDVFEALIDPDIARIEYREAGACRITHSGRQAAPFLIGAGWDPESDDKQGYVSRGEFGPRRS
jgi:hypothetical protein